MVTGASPGDFSRGWIACGRDRGACVTEPDPDFYCTAAPSLLRTPSHRVVAALPGPNEATASLEDLTEAGFPREDIYAICGEAGVQRIDPSGKHHGLRGRVIRAVENVSSDDSLFEYAHDVEAGAVLISVPAPDDQLRSRAAHILREHGGSRMRYYGAATITELG
jgi:hypothetical protein